MYRLVNMEKIDRHDLIPLIGDGGRWTKGHSKKIKKSQCLRDMKSSVFHIGWWTSGSLDEEIVTLESVHKFKEKLDEIRYGDRLLGALLKPCTVQLGSVLEL